MTSILSDNTSPDDLRALISQLQAENATLRETARPGLSFRRVDEDGTEEWDGLIGGDVPVLQKVPELGADASVGGGGPIHLIEGDNLYSLAALQATHQNKVDVIYIDPPYNTGNSNFTYADRRHHRSTAEDRVNVSPDPYGRNDQTGWVDPFRHSAWLSFMERRLLLARELMKDTGVIFLSIDDKEVFHLKLLLDAVFGEHNFVSNIVWKSGGGVGQDSRLLTNSLEYILVYAKDKTKAQFIGKASATVYKSTDAHQERRGNYNLNSMDRGSLNYNTSLDYPVEAPDGTIFYAGAVTQEAWELRRSNPSPRKDWCWRWSQDKLRWGIDNGFIEIKKDRKGAWRLYFKQYEKVDNTDTPISRTQAASNFIDHITTRTGTGEIAAILGGRAFSYPKPVELVAELLRLSARPDAVVLDFFAGSGTTGHAVATLNAADGGTRSAILMTNNEGNIARTVTHPRLVRALSGKEWADGKEHSPLPGTLSYSTVSHVPVGAETSVPGLESYRRAIALLQKNGALPRK